MKSFALAATLGVASALHTYELQYMNYLAKFGKNLNSIDEFDARLEIFAHTDLDIKMINEKSENTWVAGHNQFSDWTQEEYKSMLGLREHTATNGETVMTYVYEASSFANSVNWVDAGAVTPVKDQGQCGSCWAFSTVGSLEGAHFVATGKLLSFSEQQITDCSTNGNYGCNGGNPLNAFAYLESNDAELESVYPYVSGNTRTAGTCQYSSKSKTSVEVSAYGNVSPNSIDQLKAALNLQPVSVLIEADQRVFQTYSSGVLNTTACGTSLDHAVLAVGYGTENGQDYWLVKNSWATVWGDQGYIKLAQVEGYGICGVQMAPSHATTN